MTDERIRGYERKARAGHDPVAELRAWVEAARTGRLPHPDSAPLVERLARGELARESLALAAYAGHAGALALLREETVELAALAGDLEAVRVASGDDVTYRDLAAWLGGLPRWGAKAEIVAQLGLGRVLHDHGAAGHEAGEPMDDPMSRILRDLRNHMDAGASRLEIVLGHLRYGLGAAEKVLREEDALANRARILLAIAKTENLLEGQVWAAWVRAALLALRCAVEGRVTESPIDRFGNDVRSPLHACEDERVPARQVAAALKRVVAAFSLRPADESKKAV